MSASTKLFVVLPPATANDHVIFGVNSVRPVDEVQDVIYLPASESADTAMVKVKLSFCHILHHNNIAKRHQKLS